MNLWPTSDTGKEVYANGGNSIVSVDLVIRDGLAYIVIGDRIAAAAKFAPPTCSLEHLPANRRLFFLTAVWGAFSEDVREVMGGFSQAFDEAEESLGLGGIVCVAAQVFETGDSGSHQAEQLIRGGLRRQG